MDSATIFAGLSVDVLHVAVFIGMLVLLALANQSLFEEFISKLIVDPIALKTGKEWVKKLQPFLVFGSAVLISIGLGEPLTKIMSDVVPLNLQNDPVVSTLLNALLITAGSFEAHKRAEKKVVEQDMAEATLANYENASTEFRGG